MQNRAKFYLTAAFLAAILLLSPIVYAQAAPDGWKTTCQAAGTLLTAASRSVMLAELSSAGPTAKLPMA